MEKYVPDIYKKNIFEIDYEKLKENGIKYLLFDLDNTIAPFSCRKVSAKVQDLFYKIKQVGLKPIIFSNSPKMRVKFFGEQLNIDIFSNARKPSIKGFNKVISKYKLEQSEVAIIGDQLMTDVVGGNKAGIVTILTDPIGKDPFWTKINRIREKKVLNKLTKNNLLRKGKYYGQM